MNINLFDEFDVIELNLFGDFDLEGNMFIYIFILYGSNFL